MRSACILMALLCAAPAASALTLNASPEPLAPGAPPSGLLFVRIPCQEVLVQPEARSVQLEARSTAAEVLTLDSLPVERVMCRQGNLDAHTATGWTLQPREGAVAEQPFNITFTGRFGVYQASTTVATELPYEGELVVTVHEERQQVKPGEAAQYQVTVENHANAATRVILEPQRVLTGHMVTPEPFILAPNGQPGAAATVQVAYHTAGALDAALVAFTARGESEGRATPLGEPLTIHVIASAPTSVIPWVIGVIGAVAVAGAWRGLRRDA